MTRDEAIEIVKSFIGRSDFPEAQVDCLIALGVLRVSQTPQKMDPRAVDYYEFAIECQKAMEQE